MVVGVEGCVVCGVYCRCSLSAFRVLWCASWCGVWVVEWRWGG
nr:MAG TPA: hypothetical protein [Caudoviricetes sp.]